MSTVQQLLRRIEDFERTQKQLQEQILDIVNERDRANDRIDALERQLQQLQPQSSTEPRKAIWRSTATPDIEIISVGMAGPEELNSEVFKATAGDFSPIVIEEEPAAVSELSEVQIIPRPVLASTALKTLPSSPHTNLPFFQSYFSKENPTLIAELQRPFVTSPAIPKSRFVKRSLLASNYCKNGEIYTTQTFQGPLAGRRVLYFSQPGQGEAPTDPGMSGMFLSIKPDALFLADGQWKSVFGSKLDGSAEYYGEYMFRNLGTIPAELVVEGYARGMGLQHWYRQIREWPVSSSFLVLRARISLRNQNLTITQHVLDAEVEAIKSREGKALAHETRGAVRRAFESGDEKIHILSMTCVSYDDTFANEVFERCSQAAAKSNANCDQLSQSSSELDLLSSTFALQYF
ncbi:hypothetical protein C8J56DRAFT_210088 [Mycena floridula]|nr:hypothetical protein C8J56DRAFT_210088 [Mycena floridula]